MNVRAYYNEIDPFAAQWLRNLIAAGHIAPGDVDERSIVDVRPDELVGYSQCHFFAGIGIWSRALRRAGWSDDRPVWTGSCPCQPFSAAGKGGGFDDERHLWPAFFHLIEQCRPRVVFGEQVASKDGLAWLDLVQADLEGTGYATGALDLCAAGFGAPHIRQRLYWVADAANDHGRRGERGAEAGAWPDEQRRRGYSGSGIAGLVADTDGSRSAPWLSASGHGQEGDAGIADDGCDQFSRGSSASFAVDNTVSDGRRALGLGHNTGHVGIIADAAREDDRPGPTNGFWRDADWLHCRDGKWRPVRPGSFPLAHGASSRVGRLRAYGNAIVAAQAEAFISAFLSTETLTP